jgi:ATP-dependent DNA helicase RecG
MLTDSELLDLMTDLESDRVERKSSLADKRKIRQAICAFANDLPDHRRPGVIFIGVLDDGTCSGIDVSDEMLVTLASMRDEGKIMPWPVMSVDRRVLGGCEVVVVQVEPAEQPPVRFDGRCWIRVGPRRGTASEDEERRLIEKRRWGNLPFDQQGIPGALLDDLDLDYFRTQYLPNAVSSEVLIENQRAIDSQLKALRFLTRDGDPNAGAVLFFTPDPRQWLPGAYVQFCRFDGKEVSDPIQDQMEISGPLSETIRRTEEKFVAHISVAGNYRSGPTEARQPTYPLLALEQLFRNAMLHRSYESTNAPVRCYWFTDRVEIHSPGGLYGQVNSENFGKAGATDYRNPLIAEGMKALGYVQRFGIGVQVAYKECEKNGNPPPEFSFSPTSVLATIRRWQ